MAIKILPWERQVEVLRGNEPIYRNGPLLGKDCWLAYEEEGKIYLIASFAGEWPKFIREALYVGGTLKNPVQA